jgi:hypothetical protein
VGETPTPIPRLDRYLPRQWDLCQAFCLATGCSLVEGCIARRQDHLTFFVLNGFSSSCECAQRRTNCAHTQKHCKFGSELELQTLAIEYIGYQMTPTNVLHSAKKRIVH